MEQFHQPHECSRVHLNGSGLLCTIWKHRAKGVPCWEMGTNRWTR